MAFGMSLLMAEDQCAQKQMITKRRRLACLEMHRMLMHICMLQMKLILELIHDIYDIQLFWGS